MRHSLLRHSFLPAAALLVFWGVTTACAQTQERGGGGQPGGPGSSGFLRMFPVMAALDADGDGEISAKEIESAVGVLKSLDKDKNGKLSADELRPAGFGGGQGGGGQSGRGPGGTGGGFGGQGAAGRGGFGGGTGGFGAGPQNPEAFVTRALEFDADKDGKLSKEELGKLAEQMGRGFGGRGDGGPGGDSNRPQRPQRPELDR